MTIGAIGLMSGSSLDGVDLAYCQFELDASGELISWKLHNYDHFSYSQVLKNRLVNSNNLQPKALAQLDVDLAKLFVEMTLAFTKKYQIETTLIASHGHTISHHPELGFSLQIGSGEHIAKGVGKPCIDQFRSADIANGGQGAPLAPFADIYLYPGYTAYLNLGGIANITVMGESPKAYDIAPANQIFNYLAQKKGQEMDKDGWLGRQGNMNSQIKNAWDNISYFKQEAPKSLDNAWISREVIPIFNLPDVSVVDALHTAYRLLAGEIARSLDKAAPGKLLLSGGGTHNGFLVDCVAEAIVDTDRHALSLPRSETIDYKEAALMAWMGARRWMNKFNCLAWATGANTNSMGGTIHMP